MVKGKVKWFSNSRGYGFLEREDGSDVFVHYSKLDMQGFKTLKQGQSVEFELVETEKGLSAEKVKINEEV